MVPADRNRSNKLRVDRILGTLAAVLACVFSFLAPAPAQAGFSYTYNGRTFTDPKAALAAHQAELDAELDRVPVSPSPRPGKLIMLIPHPQEIRWLIPGNAHMPQARLDFLITWRQQYFETLGKAIVKARLVADTIVVQNHIGGAMSFSQFDYVISSLVSPHIGHARANTRWSVESQTRVGDTASGAAAVALTSEQGQPEQDPAAFVDTIRGTLLLLPAVIAPAPSRNGEAFDAAAIQSYAEAQHRECREPLSGMPSASVDTYQLECDCLWDRFAADPRAAQALTEFYRPAHPSESKFATVFADSRKACGIPDGSLAPK